MNGAVERATGEASTVTRALAADGHPVRILSRRPAAPLPPGMDVSVADLGTGAGLAEALAGVGAIVHCATEPQRSRTVDVEGTERLLGAARGAGRPHVVYVSIVGVDRIPTEYYRSKLVAEEAVIRSGLPWTVLRTTQFHEFAVHLVDRMTGLPVVPLPRGWRVQPIDVEEVARRLADGVGTGPATRLPDLGGPEILSVAELVRERLRDAGRHRPVVEVLLPGASSAALRAGANLVPGNRSGGRTWREFVDGRPQQVGR